MGMAQARGWSLKAGPGQIEPITTAEYPTPARRPANSRLDCTRFARTFEVLPPTWQEGVLATLDELKATTP
jgi:dTDP-4-dehydrorhamnose reductase